MSEWQIKLRWSIAAGISVVLILLLLIFIPNLPSFAQLHQVSGTVDSSTVDTRAEGAELQTVFTVVLEGSPDTVYVVTKGADPGYYRATQTVASGDDITLWWYPIKRSGDLRIWQLSDRDQYIVNYWEVYGVERRYRIEIILAIVFALAVVNVGTYYAIRLETTEPATPRLLEMGE